MKAVAPRIERLYESEVERNAAAWGRYFGACLQACKALTPSSVLAVRDSLQACLDGDSPPVEACLPQPLRRWFAARYETFAEALTPTGTLVSLERLPRPPAEPEGAWAHLAAQTEPNCGNTSAARALLVLVLVRGYRAWEDEL